MAIPRNVADYENRMLQVELEYPACGFHENDIHFIIKTGRHNKSDLQYEVVSSESFFINRYNVGRPKKISPEKDEHYEKVIRGGMIARYIGGHLPRKPAAICSMIDKVASRNDVPVYYANIIGTGIKVFEKLMTVIETVQDVKSFELENY